MILKGTGFNRSEDDSYSVQEFIISRDALRVLDEKLGIFKAFSNKNIDIFSRFASLDLDNSFEALYKYYQKKVDVQLDSASSIITLTTRSFTPEDSASMNQLLLEMSEALVNHLNERGQHDMVNYAEREVGEAVHQQHHSLLHAIGLKSQNFLCVLLCQAVQIRRSVPKMQY